MVRNIFTAVWLFGLAFVSCGIAARAAEAPSPTAVVERFHAALVDNMKAGKEAGFAGRRDRLAPVVAETFDLPTMARVSTGSAWAKLSDEDKARIVTAFSDWTVATYAANFKEWDGESFVTKSHSEDSKGNVLVNTRLVLKGDPPVIFDYRLRKSDDTWRIVDIFLEGAISQIAMHRGEFAAALSAGGVDNLVKHMQDLTAKAMKEGG